MMMMMMMMMMKKLECKFPVANWPPDALFPPLPPSLDHHHHYHGDENCDGHDGDFDEEAEHEVDLYGDDDPLDPLYSDHNVWSCIAWKVLK